MVKVAILSGWHVHAREYASEIKANKEAEITVVWDENVERGTAWSKELGVPFEANLGEVLKRDDVDAVCVNAPTHLHKEIMVAAAKAKKHIFTEKVMTTTLVDAEEVVEAVKENGVKFCISFPHRTRPQNLFAKQVIEEGLLGQVTLVRIRNAHNGAIGDWLPPHFYDKEDCGGGAMMDLGAHGMYLSRWFLGEPTKVNSVFTHITDKEVEDNAVSVIEFKNKAIAINETGFVTGHSPYSVEIYGTAGSILIGGIDSKIRFISDKVEAKVQGWIEPSDLPQALPCATTQWIDGIVNNTPILFGLEEAVQLTQLMEGAYLSYEQGTSIALR